MNIIVLTPDKAIFKGAIQSVKVPGTLGEFQVLNNHAPIVSSLEKGKVTLVTGQGAYEYLDTTNNELSKAQEAGRSIEYIIEGGFIEVLNNEVNLLVTGVE